MAGMIPPLCNSVASADSGSLLSTHLLQGKGGGSHKNACRRERGFRQVNDIRGERFRLQLHCTGKPTTGAAVCPSAMQSSPCSNLEWPASHRLPHAGPCLGSKHHLGRVAHLGKADRPHVRNRLPCPICASTKLAAGTQKLRPGSKQQKRLTGTQKLSLRQSSSLEPRDVPLADRFFSAVTGYPFPLGPFFEVSQCTLMTDWRPTLLRPPPALPSRSPMLASQQAL